MLIFKIALIMLAVVVGHFVIWKAMRDEYELEELFSFTTLVTLLGLTSLFWSYLGLLFGLGLLIGWTKKFKWDYWEWLDTLGPLSLLMAFILSWFDGIGGWPAAVVSLAGWFLVQVLAKFYRQFKWYPSGRLGFVGIIALGWWGVVQLMVANMSVEGVYCLAVISSLTVVALYMRSGRKPSDDFKFLWQIPKKPKQ